MLFPSCLVCIKYGATVGDDNGDDVDSRGKPLLDLSSKKMNGRAQVQKIYLENR